MVDDGSVFPDDGSVFLAPENREIIFLGVQ